MEKVLGLGIVGVIVFLAIGWFMNVIGLIGCDFDGAKTSYKTEIVRGIGVAVPPIGGVVGWLDIGEDENPTDTTSAE